MSEIVADAPQQAQQAPTQAPAPQPSPSTPNESGMTLQQAMAAELAQKNGTQQPDSSPAPSSKPSAAEKSAQAAAGEETATTEAPSEPAKKGPWDKLGKPAEQKKAETTPTEFPDEAPKEQNAWTAIKKTVKELSAERDRLTAEKAQYDAQLKEYQEKTSKYSDEDLAALAKYREEEAVNYVQRTPEYLEKAQKPWNEGSSTLNEVSEFTKIPVEALKNALTEPNSLARKRAVVALLENSEQDLSDTEKMTLADEVFRSGDKLQQAAQAHAELTQQANLKKEQLTNQQKASQMKAQEEAKKIFKASITETTDGLKAQLSDLIDAGLLSSKDIDSIRDVELSDDPMDRAFGEAAAQLMVPLTQQLRAAKAKIAELEADRQERMKTTPSVKPGNAAQAGARPVSLAEALKKHQSEGWF